MAASKDKEAQKLFQNFWRETPKNEYTLALGVALAKIAKLYFAYESLWPFLEDIPNSAQAASLCQEEIVQEEILQQVKVLVVRGLKEKDIRQRLGGLASLACWKSMEGQLKVHLQGQDYNFRQAAFLILDSQHLLTSKEREIYLTSYILRGPVASDSFNLAWKKLKSLGENFASREAITQELLRLDPLPDELWAGHDQKKKAYLFRFIDSHMPEYLEGYARKCLEFYAGKKIFPNGNPTIHCREFFATATKVKWSKATLRRQFQALQNFSHSTKKL